MKKEALLLYMFSFFMIMPMHAVFPVLPAIRDDIHASYSQISIFLASLGLVRLLLAYPSGLLADRFNQKKTLLFSGSVCFAGLLLMGFAHSFTQLLVSRALIGFSSIVCSITILSLIAQLSGTQDKGAMMSMNNVVHNAGGIVSPAITGFLAKWFNWRIPFFVVAGLILFSMAIISLCFRSQNSPSQRKTKPGRTASSPSCVQNTRLRLLRLVPVFAFGFFVFFYRGYFKNTLLPFFGKDVFHIKVHTLGIYFSLTAAVSMVSLFVLGALSDRFGRKAVLLPGIFFSTVATLILLLPQSLNPLLPCCIFIGLGAIINSMPNVILSDLVPSNIFGRVLGINRIFSDSGYFAGSLAAGILLDQFGFRIPLYCIAGYATVMMIMVGFSISNRPTDSHNTKTAFISNSG